MGYAEEQRAQARARQIREQQQVQRALQQGRAITGYSANPLEAAVQRIGSFFGIANPPRITNDPSGSQRLMVAGGWAGQRSNLPGTINVAGRTWSLSPQSRSEGANAFYTPRGTTTSTNTVASTSAPPPPILPPPQTGQASSAPSAGTSSSPAERAYQQEVSRVAQMAAQNPELQRYEAARLKAVAPGATPEQVQSAEDIGMRIWAEKYGKTLAPKVKPGQAGYDVIQGVLNAGAMGEPLDLPFSPASPLGDKALESIPTYEGASDLQPVGTPLPRTQFDTPRNQAQAQMFNRFLQSQAQVSSIAPPVNPAEATYVGATNVQPIAAGGDVALNAFSFNTPAEQRRAALFDKVIFDKLFNQAMSR